MTVGPAGRLFDLHFISLSASILRKMDRFDVLHTMGPLWQARRFSKRTRRLLVHFHHAEWIEKASEILTKPIHRLLERETIRHASKVLVPSLQTQAEIQAMFRIGSEKLTVLPHGVDSARFQFKEHRDFKPEQPHLLFVGPLERSKSIDTLIVAVRRLHERGNPVQVDVVGEGPERARLVAHAKTLGVLEHVNFLGFVPEDALIRLYQESHIFVFPSVKEGFGLVVLEAMASGLPVVASDIPPLRDILSDVGALVPPRNPVAIADTVDYLLGNPKRLLEMSRKGRKRVEEQYTWDRVVSKLETLYAS